ncbi:17063_t:CDS:2, partial [Acaulospora morrowiae]
MGYLTTPYIWLWIFVEISHEQEDPILRDWEFADYGEQKALLNPSAVIEEDDLKTISKVHAGARLNCNIQFRNHNLQIKIARHQTDTKSKNLTTSEWNGDAFHSLDQPGAESSNEIHQYKLTQKTNQSRDNCVIKLPKRAYRSAMSESEPDKVKNIPKVNINTASLDQLCRVNHI